MKKVKKLSGKYYIISGVVANGIMASLTFKSSIEDNEYYRVSVYNAYEEFDYDKLVGKKVKIILDENNIIQSMKGKGINIHFTDPKIKGSEYEYISNITSCIEPRVYSNSFMIKRLTVDNIFKSNIRKELSVWAFNTCRKDASGLSMAYSISSVADKILNITDEIPEINNMINVLLVTRNVTPQMISHGINTSNYNKCVIMCGLQLAKEYLKLSNKRDIMYSKIYYPGCVLSNTSASYNDILDLFPETE